MNFDLFTIKFTKMVGKVKRPNTTVEQLIRRVYLSTAACKMFSGHRPSMAYTACLAKIFYVYPHVKHLIWSKETRCYQKFKPWAALKMFC